MDIERMDLKNFSELIESPSALRHDINWNVLNCEIGYRVRFDRGEICTWASDFVHPDKVPHHLSGSVALHKFSEVGEIDTLDRHRFIYSVIMDLFKDSDIESVRAWMKTNSSLQIKQVLINLGWLPSPWYLYS